MTKEQYIDAYLDRYEQTHPNERIDYTALREAADLAWYDKEVEAGHKTEHDLTAEQEKTAKAIRGSAKAVNAYGKEVKRERKANPDKRELIETIAAALTAYAPTVTNAERQVDFTYKGTAYSVTLTAHRPLKKPPQ